MLAELEKTATILQSHLGSTLGFRRGAIEEAFGTGRHFDAGEEMGDFEQVLHHRQGIGAAVGGDVCHGLVCGDGLPTVWAVFQRAARVAGGAGGTSLGGDGDDFVPATGAGEDGSCDLGGFRRIGERLKGAHGDGDAIVLLTDGGEELCGKEL